MLITEKNQSISIFICDPRGARTLGPQIKSLLLYQLSYGVSKASVEKTGCKDIKNFILRKLFKLIFSEKIAV